MYNPTETIMENDGEPARFRGRSKVSVRTRRASGACGLPGAQTFRSHGDALMMQLGQGD